MNYKAVYDYCKDISQNLGITTKFFHGRKEWLNFNPNDKPLYVHLLPLTSSGSVINDSYPNETWVITILFYMQDNESSAIDQNDTDSLQKEMEVLTITEKACNKFLRQFNENSINDELEAAGDQLTITSFQKATAIKDTASMLTGIALTMNVQVPDSFDYCCV
jgi:hypothetical protein